MLLGGRKCRWRMRKVWLLEAKPSFGIEMQMGSGCKSEAQPLRRKMMK